jgi:hypothetical protein
MKKKKKRVRVKGGPTVLVMLRVVAHHPDGGQHDAQCHQHHADGPARLLMVKFICAVCSLRGGTVAVLSVAVAVMLPGHLPVRSEGTSRSAITNHRSSLFSWLACEPMAMFFP